MTVPIVHLAYKQATGWEFATMANWDSPPPGTVKVRRVSLAGEPEIRVLCGRAALELDRFGDPQIGSRAIRFLIDGGYARTERGRGLVIHWDNLPPSGVSGDVPRWSETERLKTERVHAGASRTTRRRDALR